MFLSALTIGEVEQEAQDATCKTRTEPTLPGFLTPEELIRHSDRYVNLEDETPLRAYLEILGPPDLILFDLTRALILLEEKVRDPHTPYPVWVQGPHGLILKFGLMRSLAGRELSELTVLSTSLIRAFRDRPVPEPLSFEA
jgi:hypothetical protein